MAITVKYLTGLGIDEETANKIFAERGKEIEADKAKYAELWKIRISRASLTSIFSANL